ncbi:MAG: motility protein A [Treponema sp.]|nr:motility protein A [Candidatus Treponema equifaecale]
MDIASLIGFIGGAAVIVLGVATSGGSLGGIIDIPSVLVTIGGSFLTLFIVAPLGDILGFLKVYARIFKTFDYGEKTLIQAMVSLSEKARREGILALEEGLDDLESAFMKEGLRMVVDGTDGNVIRAIMENEMSQAEGRHMKMINIVNQWAGFGPGFGMMGTVIGLIGMLNNLEDKSSLGPNMAVALITTLYGSMLANWLVGPVAQKLMAQNAQEMAAQEMIIEGVLSIQAGDNPRILAMKLLTYLDPKTRKVIEPDVLKD